MNRTIKKTLESPLKIYANLKLDVSEDVEESSIFAKHMINFIDEVNLMKGNTPLLEYLNESYSYSPN